MEQHLPTSAYNYAEFDMAREEPAFDAFKRALHVGGRAPDHPVEDLSTGEPVRLRGLWKAGPAVLEFGSFT